MPVRSPENSSMGTVMAIIYGTGGSDTLQGSIGSDTIYGYAEGTDPDLETGNDTIYGGNGRDTIYGGGGNDTLYGGNLNDTLYGGAGDDHLYGDGDNDILDGGEGNDTLWIGGNSTGIDTFRGGAGSDTVRLFENLVRSELVLDAAAGVEILDLAGFSIAGNAGGNLFDLSGVTTVLNASGIIDLGSGNDVFYGHDGADRVNGGNSDDTLFGRGGNDHLYGGSGTDELDGGAGNDTFWIGDVDTDNFLGGDGVDTVRLFNDTGRQTLTLGSANGVETLDTAGHRLSGTLANDTFDLSGLTKLSAGKAGISLVDGDDTYLGHSGADNVNGGAGTDNLQGQGGKDRLDGGGGSDTVAGGDGADSFVFSTRALKGAHDTIVDFDPDGDRLLFDNRVFDKLGRDGKLSADAFIATASGKAQDREDRLIYETDTGNLFYDANGSGKGKSVLVAQLEAGLDIRASDFLVI